MEADTIPGERGADMHQAIEIRNQNHQSAKLITESIRIEDVEQVIRDILNLMTLSDGSGKSYSKTLIDTTLPTPEGYTLTIAFHLLKDE